MDEKGEMEKKKNGNYRNVWRTGTFIIIFFQLNISDLEVRVWHLH